MYRDDERNEIIRTFRKYARLGLTKEGYNPIQIYKKIEMLCPSRRGKLDMLAVFDTVRLLEVGGEQDTLFCVREVYFASYSFRLTRNEISERVAYCAREQFCDDRTVYRRLERARKLFSDIRKREGLILDGME